MFGPPPRSSLGVLTPTIQRPKKSNMYDSSATVKASPSALTMKTKDASRDAVNRAVDSMFQVYGRPKTGGSRPVTGHSRPVTGNKSFTEAPALTQALGRVQRTVQNPRLLGGSVYVALRDPSAANMDGKLARTQVLQERKQRIKSTLRQYNNLNNHKKSKNPFQKTGETIFHQTSEQQPDLMRSTSRLAFAEISPEAYQQRVLHKPRDSPNPLRNIDALNEQGPLYRTSSSVDFPQYDLSEYAAKPRVKKDEFDASEIIKTDDEQSVFYSRNREEFRERPEHRDALLAKHEEIQERLRNPPCRRHMRPTYDTFEKQSEAAAADWATESRSQYYKKERTDDSDLGAGARLSNRGKFMFCNGGDGTGMDPSVRQKRSIYSSSALRSSLMLHREDYLEDPQHPLNQVESTRFVTSNQTDFPVHDALSYSQVARVVRPPTPHISLPDDRDFLSVSRTDFLPQYDSDDDSPSLPVVAQSPQQLERQRSAEREMEKAMERRAKQEQQAMINDFQLTNSMYSSDRPSSSRPLTSMGTARDSVTGNGRPATTSTTSSRPRSTLSVPGSRSGNRVPDVADAEATWATRSYFNNRRIY